MSFSSSSTSTSSSSSTSSTVTTTTATKLEDDLLRIHFRERFQNVIKNLRSLNKELNKCLLSLEVDPEREARHVLTLAGSLATENDKVRRLLTGLQRHQQEHTLASSTREIRDVSLQAVRGTLATLHGTRESLADVIEECRPEAEAAALSVKRPLPLDSIIQLSKRVRYTTAWPSHHDVPPPNNTKGLPTPYSQPSPQEDHMKHFSLLFGIEKYKEKEKEKEEEHGEQ